MGKSRLMKKNIFFKKMHGSGNDFILIDNRDHKIKLSDAPKAAVNLCRRHFGIGADGLILIEESGKTAFKWHFFNADGSHADMCGNGGRCAARFAVIEGISGPELKFETGAGIIKARVKDSTVKLQLTPPKNLKLDMKITLHERPKTVHFVDTGVPHTVVFPKDLEAEPVFELGRLIRYHRAFSPDGTNVNFVKVTGPSSILIRTYERGVEDETYACGTGAVASALISSLKGFVRPPVEVTTWGGEHLKIHFQKEEAPDFLEVYLEGRAVLVYSGVTEEI
jgi:diaminopimelate epimerase